MYFFSQLTDGLFLMAGMHKGCKGENKPESTAGPDNNWEIQSGGDVSWIISAAQHTRGGSLQYVNIS